MATAPVVDSESGSLHPTPEPPAPGKTEDTWYAERGLEPGCKQCGRRGTPCHRHSKWAREAAAKAAEARERVGNGFPPLTDRKQPGELGDEQLAQVVSNGLVSLAVVSEGPSLTSSNCASDSTRNHRQQKFTAAAPGMNSARKSSSARAAPSIICCRAVTLRASATRRALAQGSKTTGETSSTENEKPSFAIAQLIAFVSR